VETKERMTVTDYMRLKFKGILDPVAGFLNRVGLMPNTVTILGLLGNTVAAYFLARGQMTLGGLLVLLMGPVDALDGAMARLRGEPTEFGAFVDSVTDRYSELVIFAGLLFFYLQQDQFLLAMLVYVSAAGSVLVSYIRARAQGLGTDSRGGLLSRLGRYFVLVPGLVFNLPEVSLWILAVLTNFTAVQRIIDVRRRLRRF
jgi:CDP-diacylglycerol--glycerol-3-phosphate 3-phosphatidyltransferase